MELCEKLSGLSKTAKLIPLYLQVEGPSSDKELMILTGVKKRQFLRLLKELKGFVYKKNGVYHVSKMTPVGKYDLSISLKTKEKERPTYIQKDNYNTDKSLIDIKDSVATILDKHHATRLYSLVSKIVPVEYNAEVLNEIIRYCMDRYRRGLVKDLFKYVESCIPEMWDKTLFAIEDKRRIKEEIEVISRVESEDAINKKPELPRPVADPTAASFYLKLLSKVNASKAAIETWLKTAVPLGFDGEKLRLSVQNAFAKQMVQKYLAGYDICLETQANAS
jgi:hypothetical protein